MATRVIRLSDEGVHLIANSDFANAKIGEAGGKTFLDVKCWFEGALAVDRLAVGEELTVDTGRGNALRVRVSRATEVDGVGTIVTLDVLHEEPSVPQNPVDQLAAELTAAQKLPTKLVEYAITDPDGRFGFRVDWSYRNYWCDFTVREVVGHEAPPGDERLYRAKDWQSLPSDIIEDVEKAEVYLSGYIKWDGCSDVSGVSDGWHLCGGHDWHKHIRLMEWIYRRAMALMEREVEW